MKPSERIKELATEDDYRHPNDREFIFAIMDYLDEEYEKKHSSHDKEGVACEDCYLKRKQNENNLSKVQK